MNAVGYVEQALRRHVLIPDRREVWEWAGGSRPDKSDAAINFGNTTAFKGVYDVDNVPWTKEFLRAANDPRVREVTFVAPPQDSGKTKAAEVFLANRICTKPTNIAWYTSTNVKADQWAETRWEPMLRSVRGIAEKFSDNQNAKKRRRIVFKDGTYLLIMGAETEGNRASDSVEIVLRDEVYLWQRPWVKETDDRTAAYRDTAKRINFSVAGEKEGELHEKFLAGNQLEWCHHCPKCDSVLEYVFNSKDPRCNIRFDVNAAILHADSRMDLREFKKTIRVICQNAACKHEMGYDRQRLAEMNRRGVYVPKNPNADPTIVSLHVNAFAIGREPWEQILAPWVRMHIRGGVFAQSVLREFVIKKLAEFWDERPFVVSTELKVSNFIRNEVLQPQPNELLRVITADNQRGGRGDVPHRWFICVAFGKDGTCRVVDGGRLNEWEQLRAKQIELGVPDATEDRPGPWVAIDRRYDPVGVDEICARYKWYGMLGSAQEEFVHPPYSPFAGTRQLFTEPRAIDIGFGTQEQGRRYAMYFAWATQRVQDLVAELRNGGMIQFPRDVTTWCPEMPEHINSHRQVIEPTKTGGQRRLWVRIGDTPDHLYDCLCQAIAIGCMAGVYKNPIDNTKAA
jgi:hypothetical protein